MIEEIIAHIDLAEEYAMLSRSHRRDAGQMMRRIRKNKKLTLRELAAKLDISPSMLCLIENENNLPSLDLLLRLVKWLRDERR